ncbi:MAG: magnesium-translocating P-type ATPase [Gemmatimonadaceae bacterium]
MTASYWSTPPEKLLTSLGTTSTGLTSAAVPGLQQRYGLNTIQEHQQTSGLRLLLLQFRSPLILILIFAAIVSLVVGEWIDASIVLVVVIGSTMLGFVQEYRAGNAVEKLRSQVTIKANVMRDGKSTMIPAHEVVPGDVVVLSAGSLIPADGVILSANDLFVNQAVLTGETFPVEKTPVPVAANASVAQRINCVFMGTSVGSGTATAVMVETGRNTVFGQVAQRLSLRPEETEFERGIHRFGNLLSQVMLVMVIVVLAINLVLAKPIIDSLLFALALAVGLAPELLPAIISITLSHGAQQMAKRGVIVRRLNAIENFGGMDVFCTDKTGTLTEGVVQLNDALDSTGKSSSAVLQLSYRNAHFQTGLQNPLDQAVNAAGANAGFDVTGETKLGEIPYDFVRKRLSVIIASATDSASGSATLITKGALDNVLKICATVQGSDGIHPLDAARLSAIDQCYSDWSAKGFRVLGVATKVIDSRATYSRNDETSMVFAGFLLFFDPPRKDVATVIAELAKRGVQLKIITGDNQKVARQVAEVVGLKVEGMLTGGQLSEMKDEALWHLAEHTTIFAEVDPNQKERIILALQKTGHVVGYMGDGINDASALYAADVGISVDNAVDVAKAAADFVLLKNDLRVLLDGIDEGRRTFANTLKYILTTISANFGNMFSMAVASLFLPFLPLLAPQILLNNFLSDIPGMTIASDRVDVDMVEKPRRWDTRFIRDYMVVFGFISSAFDLLTFAMLLYVFRSSPEQFRTGWFIESLLTELVVALVVRTRLPFFRSRPGNLLLWSSVGFIALTLVIPFLPFDSIFGFVPLSAPMMLSIIAVTVAYVIAVEVGKRFFYRRMAAVRQLNSA